MTPRFEPRTDILPAAQQEIWPQLGPARGLSFVLYGGTAVALHLGHRQSVDFDFFSSNPLDKPLIQNSFGFADHAHTVQDAPNTLVIVAKMSAGPVKVSFFGGLNLGRVCEPLLSMDSIMRVASLDDLMATKLKAILDRAEVKDYYDIAAMLRAGVSLEKGLAAFSAMFDKDAGLPLRALGYFKDGDLPTLPAADQMFLKAARDGVRDLSEVVLLHDGPNSHQS